MRVECRPTSSGVSEYFSISSFTSGDSNMCRSMLWNVEAVQVPGNISLCVFGSPSLYFMTDNHAPKATKQQREKSKPFAKMFRFSHRSPAWFDLVTLRSMTRPSMVTPKDSSTRLHTLSPRAIKFHCRSRNGHTHTCTVAAIARIFAAASTAGAAEEEEEKEKEEEEEEQQQQQEEQQEQEATHEREL